MKVFEGNRVPIKAWVDDILPKNEINRDGIFIEEEALKLTWHSQALVESARFH